MKLDDDIVDVEALDAVRVAPHVHAAFEGGDDGISSCSPSAPRAEGDGDGPPDFWADD